MSVLGTTGGGLDLFGAVAGLDSFGAVASLGYFGAGGCLFGGVLGLLLPAGPGAECTSIASNRTISIKYLIIIRYRWI